MNNSKVHVNVCISKERRILSVCEERENFGRKKKKDETKKKNRHRANMSLFIVEFSQPIIYSIYLFLSFYKDKFYFISYQMNKLKPKTFFPSRA